MLELAEQPNDRLHEVHPPRDSRYPVTYMRAGADQARRITETSEPLTIDPDIAAPSGLEPRPDPAVTARRTRRIATIDRSSTLPFAACTGMITGLSDAEPWSFAS
jgi:hypothetical protein